ncbi:MAG: DUF6175 family protein [Gammaproteobacteria bacterium]|nr:DUF6175 family protein [Gammaproteobacteria bacterium]
MRGRIALLILLVAMLAACGGKKVVKSDDPLPQSRQVTEVESTSSAETLVRATGKAGSVEDAIVDAQRAALWFLLHAGSKPVLKTAAEKQAFAAIERDFYSAHSQFVRYTSDLKSKQKNGNTVSVDVLVRIDMNMLREHLVSNNVIKSTTDMLAEAGLPSISIVAAETTDDTDLARNVLGEYLTDRNYEVNVVSQSGKLSAVVNKLARLGGNTDPSYNWALEAGSDVYIEVKVNTEKGKVSGVDTRKASVTAKAFETSTGIQLGSSTGNSSERAASGFDALIQEAANAVADKLISQIRKKWSGGTKAFKLVVFTTEDQGDRVDQSIYKALKLLSKQPVKRVAAGKSTFDYVVRTEGLANAFEFMMALQQRYGGPGTITREMENGALLVVRAGAGDVDIQFD